jgi:hypothetical protein
MGAMVRFSSAALGCLLVSIGMSSAAAQVDAVEYVRICDAFGAGFYYIPGTDTCLHVGGRVRIEAHAVDRWVERGPSAHEVPPPGDLEGIEQIEENENEFLDTVRNKYTTRARGYVRLDARNQTDFGLLRTYLSLQMTIGPEESVIDPDAIMLSAFDDDLIDTISSYDDTDPELEYAFIQLSNDVGTFTAGHAGSFFDIWGKYDFGTRIGIDDATGESTLFAYTFGGWNGLSATFSVEDPASQGRRGCCVPGQELPDFIGNVRLEQGWGYAQVSGAVRRLEPIAFDDMSNPFVIDDEVGWAAAAGFVSRLPFGGWEIAAQGTFAKGMSGYATAQDFLKPDAFGLDPDDPSNLNAGNQVLETWNVRAGVSVPLTSTLMGTIDGSYTEHDAGDIECLCSGEFLARYREFSFWAVAGNLQWRPVQGLMIGAEVAYEQTFIDEETEDSDPTTPTDAFGFALSDSRQHGVGGMLRIQKDF